MMTTMMRRKIVRLISHDDCRYCLCYIDNHFGMFFWDFGLGAEGFPGSNRALSDLLQGFEVEDSRSLESPVTGT